MPAAKPRPAPRPWTRWRRAKPSWRSSPSRWQRPYSLKKHIRPTLGTLPLAEITRGQVKDLLATKRSEGLSKNAVRLVRATLSGLYADAIDAELVTANPAARRGRARGRKTPDAVSAAERRGKVRAMTVEQLAAFLKAAETGRHATLFLLLADTGMRPGEAFALTWKDIDLAPRVITSNARSRAADG